MIITIDGPAGAGKSTVARALARRLGFRLLDTGAMYRAVTLAALQAGVNGDNPLAIAQLASAADIQLNDPQVCLNGVDVSQEIRSPEVTAKIHWAADNPAVRARLVELQRREAAGGNIVCEGRDQGTVAFPHAQCKIFLTASSQARAARRQQELLERGLRLTQEQVQADQTERDERDSKRPVGALRKAEDAVEVCTDGLTVAEVVDALERIVRAKMTRSNL
jgi:cytidylate kinase